MEISRDGHLVNIGATRLRVLLVVLLNDAGAVIPVDTLVDRVWGASPPGGARNTLQNYVLRLRRSLGPDVIRTHRRGYVIDIEPSALDAHRFTALVRQGGKALERDDPERAAAVLREALALWRGDPLSDLPGELFPDVVPALVEQRVHAYELRIDADLRRGRPAEVLPELRVLTATHPLRERFWAQRMLALYQCGRQGEALACYREVTERLADELGVDPGDELRDVHQRILTAAPDLAAAPRRARPAGNLPAETTTFIGRERQLTRTRQLLELSRLVTLTGVGGVGKTRLALRAARQASPRFVDGVWVADLATLSEPALLDRAVADALGLRDQSARPAADAVAGHLRDRELLLVLDNCEHLVQEAAALSLRLLRAAPGLRILATSRERFGVPGEHVLLVPGLTLPDRIGPGPGTSTGTSTGAGTGGTVPSEALRLLADRAAASSHDHADSTYADSEPAAELCRRLDGIPLAIELAAVRLASLTIEQVLERLEDRFRLLTAPRTGAPHRYQHTLRGVIDWSYSLCTPGERLLWKRLSVFTGSCDLDAAEAVCAGDGTDADGIAREDVVDLLTGLVHKSIVVVENTRGTARYRLLETIRQYGMSRLEEDAGAATGLRLRHSDHYHRMTVRAATEWCGPAEVTWLLRLRAEVPNIRAALEFCRDHPGRAAIGVEIAVHLTRTRFWFFGCTPGEGRHWLESLVGARDDLPDELNVLATAMKAWIALCQGDRPAARRFAEDCRTAAANSPTVAALYIEGAYDFLVHDSPGCVERLARARDGFRAAGHPGDAHMATMMWAMAAAFLATRETAWLACRAYVTEAEANGAEWAHSWAIWCTGLTEVLHGDPAAALEPLRDALGRQHAIDDSWGPVWTVETIAWAIGALGDHRRAARLLGAADRLRGITGVALTGLQPFHAVHTRTERRARERLGAEVYAEEWNRGAATEQGVALALTLIDEASSLGVTDE
ncbi:BTAD domain-containing putative transcriptional regulator [Streptomyces ficellus]|uniref:BTAD domain-containing putative transcriptional regulator n=1 Tax=Streptomyces ficellus TaxID=1977088 RepID=UPI001FCBF6A9|nr:BTAD domain-containing putative transcriptional regulator [Streptomyces ficellus]